MLPQSVIKTKTPKILCGSETVFKHLVAKLLIFYVVISSAGMVGNKTKYLKQLTMSCGRPLLSYFFPLPPLSCV